MGSEAGRLRGGPRGPACRAGMWELSHQRPEQGCSHRAYLPAHSGNQNEGGSPWSRGSCLITNAGVSRAQAGQVTRHTAVGGAVRANGRGSKKGPPQHGKQVPPALPLACPSGPLAPAHHRQLLRARPALHLSAE